MRARVVWLKTLFVLLAVFQGASVASAPAARLSLDAATGLPRLELGGAVVMTPAITVWKRNWAWTEYTGRTTPTPLNGYAVEGRDKELGLSLQGTATRTDKGIEESLTVSAAAARDDLQGGAFIFRFDLGAARATLGEPELLPGRKGFRWGSATGPHVELTFSQPVAAIYFEPGGRSELRAFLFQDRIAAGDQVIHLSWTVGGGVEVRPTLQERLGGPAAGWPPLALGPADLPPDLGLQSKDARPAGRHGALRAKEGRLEFADGTPARFWGTNLAAYALFGTPHDAVRQEAHRMAALGINLVRIHHHDSPWVTPNLLSRKRASPADPLLDEAALERIDWWVQCLEQEGIYVWLDLHVQRALVAADNIEAFDEIKRDKGSADLKGYAYVNGSIQSTMARLGHDYLAHRNAHTGLTYFQDPAVLFVLLTNEDDVTQHFGNSLLPDKHVPRHTAWYMAKAEAFAKDSGLPKDRVWRSWEPGPGRIFLNDLEHAFDVSQLDPLRAVGLRPLVATTSSWGDNPLSSLPALTTGDVVDVHAYGGPSQLEKDPGVAPTLTSWMGAAQVVGWPLTVSEWNVEPFPVADRHVVPLLVAATAAHQGWAAVLQYAWSQEPMDQHGPSAWNGHDDPSLATLMPAAALIYRQSHVTLSSTTYVLALDPSTYFDRAVSPRNSLALRTAMLRGRLLVQPPPTPALPWWHPRPVPAGATLLSDPDRGLLPAGATAVTSDDGQLRHDWAAGIFVIDTRLTKAAMGWLGGRHIDVGPLQTDLATPSATVVAQSLDGKPVGTSRHLFVTLATRSQPQPGNQTPYLVEPAAGRITITAPPGLDVVAWTGSGRHAKVAAAYEHGAYVLVLDGKGVVPWWTIGHPGN